MNCHPLSLALFIFFTSTVHASRARVASLQSNHLNDSELTFILPTKLIEIENYALIESGSTLSANPAERPYFSLRYALDTDTAFALTFGRTSQLIDGSRLTSNLYLPFDFDATENGLDANYAARAYGMSFSLGIYYAAKKDRANVLDNQGATLNLGFRLKDFSFGLNAGLYNYVDHPSGPHLSLNQSFLAHLLYELDDIDFFVSLSPTRIKEDISGIETNNLELLNSKMSVIKNTFNGEEIIFYRIDFETRQLKDRLQNKIVEKVVSLPITLGVETSLNKQLRLRGSISQTVGVYQSEYFGPGPSTTTAALGLGVQFKKIVVDGILQGATGGAATQRLDADHFLSQVALNYFY